MHERGVDRRPQGAGRLDQTVQPVRHDPGRLIAHQAPDGQWQLRQDPALVVDRNLSSADFGQARHGGGHGDRAVGGRGTHCHAVVRVVPDGRGQGAPGQAESLHPSESDPAGPAVSLDHGQTGHRRRRGRKGR